ncbi:MAG: hypothetical protein J6T20_07115 [Treponema sp.]|nr:hypothetical protein [Treponema sp.]
MKKSVSTLICNLSIIFTAFVLLCLCSCTGLLQKTGSVSFIIDKALLQAVARNGGDGYEGPQMQFEVSLEGSGGYGVRQTILIPVEDYDKCMQTDRKFEANFDNVPAGKTYYAYIKVFRAKEGSSNGEPLSEPILIGKSKAFKVKAGENIVDMKAFSYRCEYDFSLEIKVPEGYIAEELQNLLSIDVILADSSVAQKLIAAGTDKYKLYDVFSKNALPSVMNFNYIPDSERITFKNDGSTLQIEGKIDLPVDENTYGTCGKEVIFIASAKNYEEPAPYLYGKSAKVTPVKNSILNAVFEINKIKVLETPLLTYNVSGSGDSKTYSYNLGDKSPIEVTNSDFFTCFDADGNLISVSKTGWSSTGKYDYKIISSDRNEEITVSNVPYIFTGVTCDLETNKVYVYEINTAEPLRLWDITEIKNTGIATMEFNDTTITIEYEDVVNKNLIEPYHVYDLNGVVINNGVLYDFVYSNELPPCLVITNSIPEGQSLTLTPDRIIDFDIDGISSIEFCEISDMVFINNALYVLFNYNDDTVSGMACASDNAYINSRGVLVKYDAKTQNIKKLGWTDSALDNTGTSISLIPYYYDVSNISNSIIYETVPDKPLQMTPDPNKIAYGDVTFEDIFPKFYTPESVDSYNFFGPEKIIAIKPKQLVIADDGRAFYTDNMGTYRYKNANRIVTVDLESFSITDITTAECTFDNEYNILVSSHYLSTDVLTTEYASLWTANYNHPWDSEGDDPKPVDTRLYIPRD